MRIAMTNFTGGEVAPSLNARYDLARYKNSVQCMENFLPNVHGNVERRPGTRFIADLGQGVENDAILIPFSFSVDAWQNFVLIFSDKKLRIAQYDALVSGVEIVTPYIAEDVKDISFAQVGDIVYIAHKNYPLHKVVRSGSAPDYDWALQEVVLNSSLTAPPTPAVSFTGDANGYTLRYKVVAVDANGIDSLPSAAGSVNGRHPSDWVVGNRVNISWGAVSGATEYNIYREEAGYFGFIGVSESTSFVDNNYEADIADTPREDWNPFEDGNNPGVVSFHQQRMVLASTPMSPQAFYMSRVGDFENFRKSRPLQEDDPVEYHIASGNIDTITWAASFGDLLVGTSGSEYKVSGEGSSISATNVQITAQSYWGSSNLFPIVIGNSIMHVQRHGARVRDLFYSLEKDGYAGNDLSIMAPHLFDGFTLRQWAFQQTPYSTIWVVRSDGTLLALTYMKEHEIWGWSRHITQGNFRSVVSVSGANEDAVYAVVERDGHYYLERMVERWDIHKGVNTAIYLDASKTVQSDTPFTAITGLEHLEGKEVDALVNGSPVSGLVVQSGAVNLPYEATYATVGLRFESVLAPQVVEGDAQSGTTLCQVRGIGKGHIRLEDSVGGQYGVSRDTQYDFPFVPTVWGEAVEPVSTDIEFNAGNGQGTNETVWIKQTLPLPFNVNAIVLNIDIS